MASFTQACVALTAIAVSSCSSSGATDMPPPHEAGGSPTLAGSGGRDGSGGSSVSALAGAGAGGTTDSRGGGAGTGSAGSAGALATGGSSGTTTGGGGHDNGGASVLDSAGNKGGGAGGGGGSAGAGAPTDFVCTQFMGLQLTSQWYAGGFETVVPAARYEIKWAEHAYVEEWANPNSTFWNLAITSPCSQQSTSPDRVVLTALSWTIMAEMDWEAAVTADVNNIKAHNPNVKSIELMTIIRGPGNAACGDPNVYAESTHIPATLDQALLQVAAKFPGLVSVAPKFEASACSDFEGTGPHLTAAGDTKIGKLIGAYYAK
jgi:hypothetical protein